MKVFKLFDVDDGQVMIQLAQCDSCGSYTVIRMTVALPDGQILYQDKEFFCSEEKEAKQFFAFYNLHSAKQTFSIYQQSQQSMKYMRKLAEKEAKQHNYKAN